MAASRAGIKSITLVKKGTLANPVVDGTMLPVYIGQRDVANLNIKDHNTTQDYRNRNNRNMLNFAITAPSRQVELTELDRLIQFCKDGGCDAQFVAVESQGPSTGSVFNFTGASYMGVGFEYENSNKYRNCKVNLEVAQEYDTGKTIISSSLTPAIAALADNPQYNKSVPPYLTSVIIDGGYSISREDLIEWKLTLKTKGNKTIYNRDGVNYITATLEIKTMKSNVNTLVTLLGKVNFPSVVFEQKNLSFGSTAADTPNNRFVFSAGALALANEPTIGDDKRELVVKFEGDIPLDQIVKSVTGDYAVLTFN